MDEAKWKALVHSVTDALPEAQKEAAAACETAEDLIALAGKAGVELPDELMDAVAGGKNTFTGYTPTFGRYMPDQTKVIKF